MFEKNMSEGGGSNPSLLKNHFCCLDKKKMRGGEGVNPY